MGNDAWSNSSTSPGNPPEADPAWGTKMLPSGRAVIMPGWESPPEPSVWFGPTPPASGP